MRIAQIFDGKSVPPQEILEGRSSRRQHQIEFINRGCKSLVSFTLNIPGPIKQFPMAQAALQAGRLELLTMFQGAVCEEAYYSNPAGDQILFRLDLPPLQTKEHCLRLEQRHPLGRLFDLDVLDPLGRAISRTRLGIPPRKCLLCNHDAKICVRSQTHPMSELQEHAAHILDQYFRDVSAEQCAILATRAMLYEVATTPKPGLVDRTNAGSHQDMGFFTFLDSSTALFPWFQKLFCVGWDGAEYPASELFRQLRFVGCQAERAMFTATGGINTHKGLIFSLGFFVGH